jgi:hypothetical protein
VHERLVESWLDNASERKHQAAFCQMLAAEGHRIVHSTRHGPLEFGKDVVTVDASGTPCAFQLKGNPGGRLTLNEFRGIEPQLRQLTDAALPYPDLSGTQHRSFLVTNGLVEEEVTHAIEALNQSNTNAGYPARRLEMIQRGDLLDMSKRLGHSLWPTEVGQLHLLLEMLVEEGTGQWPADRANRMLTEILGLTAEAKPKWTASEVGRRISSAGLMTSLSLKNFNSGENHLGSISAWTQFAAAAVAACERFQCSFKINAGAAVDIAMTAVYDSLVDLAEEVLTRTSLVEGEPFIDSGFYRARYTLLVGLLSLLWLWADERGWPEDISKEEVERFLEEGRSQLLLWGEGAIPQFLAYCWVLRRVSPGATADGILIGVLNATTSGGKDENSGLASPYWDFESTARHALAPLLHTEDPLEKEAVGRASFFAEALLHLLVRTNRKTSCRQAWPDITRIQHARFRPRHPWQYCLSHTEQGEEEHVQFPLRKEWTDLVIDARSIRCDGVPQPMLDVPFLLPMFIMVFPYRAFPDVVRRLSYVYDKQWLIAGAPIT